MTADSVPAPMVQLPAALIEELREAFTRDGYGPGPVQNVARAVVDAAAPAASVPAAEILALAQQMEDANTEHGTMPRVRMQVRREWAARLRALTTPHFDPYAEIREDMREDERQRFVAAAEQADKGEAADTPHISESEALWRMRAESSESILTNIGALADDWQDYFQRDDCSAFLTYGAASDTLMHLLAGQTHKDDPAPAAPPDPSAGSVNASVHRATRGGYTSNKQVGDLAPPPKGPAPGARVPVNDEAEADGYKGPETPWGKGFEFGYNTGHQAGYDAGFRAARGEDA